MSVPSLRQEDDVLPGLAPPGAAPVRIEDHALGLQYCRIGILSLMRLQLAIERGDRSRVLEAIDDLHAFDAEVEHVVEALAVPADDVRLALVARRLKSEKMAVAFEKLALASGISGPGLSSQAALADRTTDTIAARNAPDAEAVWPPPEARSRRLIREHGVQAAVMLGILLAVALLFLLL